MAKKTIQNFQKAAGIASGATNILGNTVGNLSGEGVDEIEALGNQTVKAVQNTFSKSSLSQFVADWIPQSSENMGLSGLSGAVSGAASGASAGPWGALAGGVIGGISSLFGSSARKQAREEANRRVTEAITAQNTMLSMKEAQNALANIVAFGGWVNSHGGDFPTGFTTFKEGGSHEENLYNGILQGVDENGVPNLVEEGETKWNNYIFSDRLKVPKGFDQIFNLGKSSKDTTYAKASKKISKESLERPFDSISKRGRDVMLGRLVEAQETQKLIDNEDKFMNKLLEDNGFGETLYAEGGSIHIKPSKRGTFTAAAKKHGKGVQEFARQVLANKDNYSPAMVKKANFARNAAKWHDEGGFTTTKGFYKEVPNSPYVAGTGPNVGININYTGNTRAPKYSIPDIAPSGNILRNEDYAHSILSGLPTISSALSRPKEDLNTLLESKPIVSSSAKKRAKKPFAAWDTLGLFAPAITNLGTAISDITSTPEEVSFGRMNLTDYMKRRQLPYEPIDKEYLANKYRAQAGAITRGIVDTAGGNAASARAALVAHNYNTLNALGDMYFKADELNRQRRKESIMFDVDQDQRLAARASQEQGFNINIDAQEQQQNAQNRAAARSARRAGVSNIGQSIGEISRYLGDVKRIQNMFDYGTFGEWLDKYLNGNSKSKGGLLKDTDFIKFLGNIKTKK